MNFQFTYRKKLMFTGIIILGMLILIIPHIVTGGGGGGPVEELVRITFTDFAPVDGDYDMNWPGPPRRPWTESDKEYYKATIELLGPAPCTISIGFYIKSDRFGPDPTLGYFMATFPMGENVATPQFWLVCTKKGKVKGSDGKHAKCSNVYLEPFSIAKTQCPIYWENKAKRWTHKICCE